ncbi:MULTISPECIES: hypothetical protein [Sorangium]|uniref:Secreted protein n=1 Tax=Sorangium cellulosum TaxID=56 RepID=A0A4P2QJM9_SORCE|nr:MULTISPECIES: hypothetical protein [Sorangium]AUX30199.1 hypothetical protein SOCE836_022970 [Sorangium cellulosum]WCQ89590.1 hypothetical protein NQZ70_02280 [Sorangium sp. Soce836]
MRTRLVRIACLFASATSAASAAVAVLGLASSPALAEEKPGPAQQGEKPSSAAPAEGPKADAAAPPGGAKAAAPKASAAAPRAGAKKKAPEPAPLPPAPARIWLIAPSPKGPWTMRIDNEGERPMRIPADVRLLRFEIDTLNKRTKKTTRCAAPAGLKPSGFPERRALLLAPGQSYVEHFDPRLLCFGKDEAALAGGAVVRAWYGWGPPPKWSRKAPSPPFAAESTDDPPAFAPAPGLAAPTVVLSYGLPRKEAAADGAGSAAPPSAADHGAQPSADGAAQPPADKTAQPSADKAPPQPPADKTAQPPADKPIQVAAGAPGEPIVDANAPRLELTSEPWSDAASPRSIVVRVSAKNAGRRPMTVAIRSRMLAFLVVGPNGTTVCEASPPTGAIPRDMFRTLKPGASVDLSLLLREVCPDNTFAREGLYQVKATLHANEPGTGLGLDAYTAIVRAKSSTLLRVKSAPEPFYAAAPRAVPTPKPEEGEAPEPEDGERP